ncbi:MAG: hypothetical protein H7641_07725 [Candidatus Heimdallarchaeota archaeon]|nr:hypothetical protein [Candidatus Heimdallarchaeota archaeon]MCK4877452.1 hypothetical protein [Candidatus Heimdallarchaeota archaeon]
MSSLLKKVKELFISKEKIFTNTLIEELENNDFINLRKLTSKLSIQQRYKITNKLISNSSISGILLPETTYYFSIQEEDLTNIRNQLKGKGSIDLSILKEKWEIKNKYLELLLLHFEKGILTLKTYYTMRYLREYILSALNKEEEYDINLFNEKLGVELDDLIKIILGLIDEELLLGVLQNNEAFLNATKFEELISEYTEEKYDLADEIEFDEISTDLKVSQNYIEKYLVSIVEKTPGMYAVYPLEKKIRFKK